MKFAYQYLPAAFLGLLLASCGGGGGGAGGLTVVPTNGIAVDGYLVGSEVVCDADGNGFASATNVKVSTTAGGKYTFSQGCNHAVAVRGGKSEDTQANFVGLLRAPKGATVVSPLTSLIVAGVAQDRLNAALGLPSNTNLSTTDPMLAGPNTEPVNPALKTRTLALAQLLQTHSERISGLDAKGVSNVAVVYDAVVKGIAQALASGVAPVLVQSDKTANLVVLSQLVNAATDAVIGSTAVVPEIKDKLSALDRADGSNALANASAIGLKTAIDDYLSKVSQANILQVATSRQLPLVVTSDAILKAISQGTLTGNTSDADVEALAKEADGQGVQPSVTSTNYLFLANDTLTFNDGYLRQNYTLAQFQAQPGINVEWPMYDFAALEFTLTDAGSFSAATSQTVSAAVAITSMEAGNQGAIKFFVDGITVAQKGTDLMLSVPTTAVAKVYGIEPNGSGEALKDFSSTVAGATITLSTAAGSVSELVLGNAINSAVNSLGSAAGLSGTYKVTLVVNSLPLAQADGTPMAQNSVSVPLSLNPFNVRTITGPGLEGYITLTPR
jgi:hypothetical protein